MAPLIVNLAEWRAHLLHRLRRQVELTADPDLHHLYEELRGYPGGESPFGHAPGRGSVVAPLRLRHDDGELTFFSIVASFGTPVDITVDELAIESFFPADAHTAESLRAATASAQP
jgi:hypothetical protein